MRLKSSLAFLYLTTTIAAAVSLPTLRMTLPASWDENWFGSPAVYDLDGDGSMEIIAGRHSVLYVWDNAGALRWRAPVGESSTSQNDHGTARQYAAPVVCPARPDARHFRPGLPLRPWQSHPVQPVPGRGIPEHRRCTSCGFLQQAPPSLRTWQGMNARLR